MATEFCQKCKQAHPGCLCDYDDKGNCAESVGVSEEQVEESKSTKESPKPTQVPEVGLHSLQRGDLKSTLDSSMSCSTTRPCRNAAGVKSARR